MSRPTFMDMVKAVADRKGYVSIVDLFVIKEAFASVALEHPEWDSVGVDGNEVPR